MSAARRGYRNGKRQRSISTGPRRQVIELPRTRVSEGNAEREWQSKLIGRYQRRGASVDQALLGCYLSGANGRRIWGAPSPLLRRSPLSKSSISRLVGWLEALRVRMPNKVISVPVLVGLGVREDRHKVIMDLELFQNLERHAPRHAIEEVKSDYHKIVCAESLDQANKAQGILSFCRPGSIERRKPIVDLRLWIGRSR